MILKQQRKTQNQLKTKNQTPTPGKNSKPTPNYLNSNVNPLSVVKMPCCCLNGYRKRREYWHGPLWLWESFWIRWGMRMFVILVGGLGLGHWSENWMDLCCNMVGVVLSCCVLIILTNYFFVVDVVFLVRETFKKKWFVVEQWRNLTLGRAAVILSLATNNDFRGGMQNEHMMMNIIHGITTWDFFQRRMIGKLSTWEYKHWCTNENAL